MNITLTDSLVKRIQTMREQKSAPNLMLRVQVNGGGCQGFEYSFDLVNTKNNDDQIFEKSGVQVVVDEVSLPFLDKAEIDYVDDLIGAHFKINNPNASSSCGCGTSFSI